MFPDTPVQVLVCKMIVPNNCLCDENINHECVVYVPLSWTAGTGIDKPLPYNQIILNKVYVLDVCVDVAETTLGSRPIWPTADNSEIIMNC